MRPRFSSAIADIIARSTAELNRWAHRVGVTGRALERHPHPGSSPGQALTRRTS